MNYARISINLVFTVKFSIYIKKIEYGSKMSENKKNSE